MRPPDSSSLERLVPDELAVGDATGEQTHRLHVERYAFAARHARAGRLLDIACGVGYGTRYLADHAEGVASALGVDLSPEAVAYAAERYGSPRVAFAVGDAAHFQDAAGFDTVVSLETIEHLELSPERTVTRLRDLLRRGGVCVASVPTTPSVDVNPHHRHDFTERSFRRLFEGRGFRELASLPQVQPVSVRSLMRGDERRMREARGDLHLYYAKHPRALLKRVAATLRFGFTNHYITIAWCRDS